MYIFGACDPTHWVEESVATHAVNKTIKSEKTEDSDCFSEMKHKHDNPVTSLDYAHIYKSIIYVTM